MSLRSEEILITDSPPRLIRYIIDIKIYGFSIIKPLDQLLLLASAAAAEDQTVRSIFHASKPLKDASGNWLPITKSNDSRLEVSKVMQRGDGEWDTARSLGGYLSHTWLQEHANGHPNTTVVWSNGTTVPRDQARALIPIGALDKREPLLDIAIWGGSRILLTTKTVVAGFTASCLGTLFLAGAAWLAHAAWTGFTTALNGGGSSRVRRSQFEQYVYYQQSVTNREDTGQWPSTAEMQGGIQIALQDMANNDLQAGCYDMAVQSTGEGCYESVFATMGFCSWMSGGSCATPACGGVLGQTYGSDCWGNNVVYTAGSEQNRVRT